MSIRASNYAKEMTAAPNGERLSPAEKLLLMCLADYHNPEKCAAWPSLPRLSEESLTSTRNARRLIDSLEKKGVIKTIIPTTQGRGMITVYRFIHLDGDVDNMSPFLPKEDEKGDKKGDKKEDKKEDKSTPAIRNEPVTNEPKQNPSKPSVSRGKGSEPKATDPRHQPLVEYIDSKWKTANKTTDSCPWEGHDFRRIDVMLKRVKNWALPVLKQCVDNVYKSADMSPDAFAAWSPPGDFIKILPRYRGGLLDRFGKPLRGTTKPEVSRESPSQKLAKQQASGV